jgi:L-fuculose-phosphate aldolase
MDLSDGMMRDLPRLLGGLGADMSFDRSILPPELTAAACAMSLNPEELFLLGGEDYALIGSCDEQFWPLLVNAVPEARLLGRVVAGPGIMRHGQRLSWNGFDHFSGDNRRCAPQWNAGDRGSGGPEEQAARRTTVPEAMRDMIAVGRDAWSAGLMAGFNGNISRRAWCDHMPDQPRRDREEARDSGPSTDRTDVCLITRSGAAKGRLTEHDFSLLDLRSGTVPDGPPASTESALHLAIYAACPQSRAVLHLHPPCLLALSLSVPPENFLVLPLPEARTYRAQLGRAPFQPPGSMELAAVTAEAARTHQAVWLERHGLVVHAADAHSALALAEELEHLAKVQLGLLAASHGTKVQA